jgi:hypothetical protein
MIMSMLRVNGSTLNVAVWLSVPRNVSLSFFALTSRSLAHVLECFQRRIDLHLDLCDSLELKRGLVLDLFYVLNDRVDLFRFNAWSAALSFEPAWSAPFPCVTGLVRHPVS